uniref:prostate stem cell antigen-like n=1 Tax=Doryrhamphus excisus TaxID=161450 RepID=UPI0025ADD2BF|nr:prostate stem cell antigen-like [Doryrhamphus excisus]
MLKAGRFRADICWSGSIIIIIIIIMSASQILMLLCCLPLASCLQCYTCLFPAISPLDCLKFPQECPVGQRCLSSVATGKRGALQVTMYEKSCAIPSQCGVSGQKYASGLYFNYTNVCCNTDLCNGAAGALRWGGGATLCLLPALSLLLA